MNRAGVFAIVAAGAAVGAVAGQMVLGKKPRGGQRQQPYAAIGSGLIATAAAAVLYNAPTCPPCAAGTVPNGSVTGPTSLSRGGYVAASAFAAVLGGVIGATVMGKQKGPKLLGQQPYAPIGAALAASGAAAVFYPTAPTCPPCISAAPPITTATPGGAPVPPVTVTSPLGPPPG